MIRGFYSTDCGLDINSTIEQLEEKNNENKLKRKGEYMCRTKGCGKEGHFDSRSFLCPFNKVNVLNKKVADGIIVPNKQREPAKGSKAEHAKKKINDSASNANRAREQENNSASDAKPAARKRKNDFVSDAKPPAKK